MKKIGKNWFFGLFLTISGYFGHFVLWFWTKICCIRQFMSILLVKMSRKWSEVTKNLLTYYVLLKQCPTKLILLNLGLEVWSGLFSDLQYHISDIWPVQWRETNKVQSALAAGKRRKKSRRWQVRGGKRRKEAKLIIRKKPAKLSWSKNFNRWGEKKLWFIPCTHSKFLAKLFAAFLLGRWRCPIKDGFGLWGRLKISALRPWRAVSQVV